MWLSYFSPFFVSEFHIFREIIIDGPSLFATHKDEPFFESSYVSSCNRGKGYEQQPTMLPDAPTGSAD